MFVVVDEAGKFFVNDGSWEEISMAMYCDCQDCPRDTIDTSCQCK